MPEQRKSAEDVFAAAIEIADPAERRAYLDRSCGGDKSLRVEVESLLAAHERAGPFLQEPPTLVADALANPPAPLAEKSGDRIGRYKLLEKIGEGGFGEVWMADQEVPVRRRVALKIIKLGMDTREVVARFEAERQALALMDHPNIARVFDGGATGSPESEISNPKSQIPAGRPYFVMELVRGEPITKYCDAQQLTLNERLELFVQVCQAVQHAHQKGVIHRDLKPSNILVAIHDDKPVPKVIDFGIAKATQQRLTEKTLFTRFNQFVGTPAYMSPEQAGLSSLDVDTRSDIYSLGVLLYELLTGRTPFSKEELLAGGYDEICRIIREKEPPKPSTRWSTMSATDRSRIAAQRKVAPEKLGRLVSGELDWVVMKALEKDRTRRYETPNALALDLRRYLSNEPVTAAPPSTAYRIRRFARRNRMSLTIGLTFVSVLVGGIVASTWQALRAIQFARAASDQAQRNFEMARAYRGMTERLLFTALVQSSISDPRNAILILVNAGLAVDTNMPPETQAEIWELIGDGWLAGKEALENDVLSDADSAATPKSQGRIEDRKLRTSASSCFEEALILRNRSLTPVDTKIASTEHKLAQALMFQGDPARAVEIARMALGRRMSVLGPNTDPVAETQQLQGTILRRLGRFADALQMHSNAWVFRSSHEESDNLDMLQELATSQQLAGQAHDAEVSARRILESAKPGTTYLKKHSAEAYPQPVYFAEFGLRPPVRVGELTCGSEDYFISNAHALLAASLIDQHRFQEAEHHARVSLMMRTNAMKNATDWRLGEAQALLGGALLGQDRLIEAEPLLLDGHQLLNKRKLRAEPYRRFECLRRIVELYQNWDSAEPGTGKATRAIEWRAKLAEFEKEFGGHR